MACTSNVKIRIGAFKPTILSNVVVYRAVTKLTPVLPLRLAGVFFQAKLKLALLTLSNLLYLVMLVVLAGSVSKLTPVLNAPDRGFLLM